MEAAKGRTLLNLDTRVDVSEIARVYDMAGESGRGNQLLAGAAQTPEDLARAVAVPEQQGVNVSLMRDVHDDRIAGLEPVSAALGVWRAHAARHSSHARRAARHLNR